ncbi:hypothetical protein RN001_012361 [Aquatica leii]|uniref:Lipase domain-containing protein n=1 Tax=Aquatica leii TaxID=1421715 RepID=A0AAN7SF42_9COLE|nr:hypothetical protein RN001_012361 [Aquatica leii]
MFFIFIYILTYCVVSVDLFQFLDQLLLSTRNANQTFEKYTSCFGDIGCISITEEWYHQKYRPQNVKPLDRNTIKTEFNVVVKSKNSVVFDLDFIHIKNGSEIEKPSNNSKIVLLIHDFTSNGLTGWIKHVAALYLIKEQVTVVSVDWQAGAEPPFEQAISNARVVALEIIAFLKDVKKKGIESVHIVGHGVGAHIAGYVGHSKRVLKIIGLDPTGPYFENMPAVVRLDPEDATWVEVIHTDAYSARSQGTQSTMGHFDFYVNGADMQPLCNDVTHLPKFTKLDRNSIKEGAILPACSHKRSFKYYIEAIHTEDCQFIGFQCKNYKEFLKGKCIDCFVERNLTCAKIGATKNEFIKPGVSYFLKTADSAPFCMNPYKVTMFFDEKTHGKSERTGTFELLMINDAGFVATAHPTNDAPASFVTTEPFSMIHYAKPPVVVNLAELRLKWIHNPNSLCVFCNNAVYVRKVHIQLISISKNE